MAPDKSRRVLFSWTVGHTWEPWPDDTSREFCTGCDRWRATRDRWSVRLLRWLALHVCAFYLRHGHTPEGIMETLTQVYGPEGPGHHDAEWRWQLLNDAQALNRRKALT